MCVFPDAGLISIGDVLCGFDGFYTGAFVDLK